MALQTELKELTTHEVHQLWNIDFTTISVSQWAYLGAFNQSLLTTASPEFANMTVSSGGYLYFGDSGTDGSWRIGVVSDEFVIQRRESGSWVKYFGQAA